MKFKKVIEPSMNHVKILNFPKKCGLLFTVKKNHTYGNNFFLHISEQIRALFLLHIKQYHVCGSYFILYLFLATHYHIQLTIQKYYNLIFTSSSNRPTQQANNIRNKHRNYHKQPPYLALTNDMIRIEQVKYIQHASSFHFIN